MLGRTLRFFKAELHLNLCLVILLILVESMSAFAQEREESEEASIVLSTADASPGGVGYLSLRFDSSDRVPSIQQIQTTVCFPGDLLEFENFFLGQTVEAAGAEVKHHLEESVDCTRLILQITFKAFPKLELLGSLEFRVNIEAPIGDRVEVKVESELTGEEGRVATSAAYVTIGIIDPVSIFACFFYMH